MAGDDDKEAIMNKEQLKEIENTTYEKMAILDAEIRSLRLKIIDARSKYIAENCPLKVGDIATVISSSDTATKICIHAISIRGDRFDFKFGKIKKDGSPSNQSAGIYWWNKVILPDGTEILAP